MSTTSGDMLWTGLEVKPGGSFSNRFGISTFSYSLSLLVLLSSVGILYRVIVASYFILISIIGLSGTITLLYCEILVKVLEPVPALTGDAFPKVFGPLGLEPP